MPWRIYWWKWWSSKKREMVNKWWTGCSGFFFVSWVHRPRISFNEGVCCGRHISWWHATGRFFSGTLLCCRTLAHSTCPYIRSSIPLSRRAGWAHSQQPALWPHFDQALVAVEAERSKAAKYPGSRGMAGPSFVVAEGAWAVAKVGQGLAADTEPLAAASSRVGLSHTTTGFAVCYPF